MKDIKITTKGVYIHTESELVEGWELMETAKDLIGYAEQFDAPPEPVGLHWIGALIPKDVIAPVLGTIHEFPNMETGYILGYNRKERKWIVQCPKQHGSGGSVKFFFSGDDMPEDYLAIGTIHTHPNMGAFWSGTDMADQRGRYGVHVVFGLAEGKPAHFLMTIFSPRGQYDTTELFESDIDWKADYQPNEEWVKTIKLQFAEKPVRVHIDLGKLRDFKYAPPPLMLQHFGLNEKGEVLAADDPASSASAKLPKFMQNLVNVYGYDPEILQQILEEGMPDDEPEYIFYKVLSEDFDENMFGKEVRQYLEQEGMPADFCDIPVTAQLNTLAQTLQGVLPHDWLYEAHGALNLHPYENVLNILMRYLPITVLCTIMEDHICDLAYAEVPGAEGETMLCHDSIWEWACGVLYENETVTRDYKADDLERALNACSVASVDKHGKKHFTLSWPAAGLLCYQLFDHTTPADVFLLFELYRRMQREGRIWC